MGAVRSPLRGKSGGGGWAIPWNVKFKGMGSPCKLGVGDGGVCVGTGVAKSNEDEGVGKSESSKGGEPGGRLLCVANSSATGVKKSSSESRVFCNSC